MGDDHVGVHVFLCQRNDSAGGGPEAIGLFSDLGGEPKFFRLGGLFAVLPVDGVAVGVVKDLSRMARQVSVLFRDEP